MRIFIALVAACVVIGGIAAHHRRSDSTAAATPTPALSPRAASQHDWAKSALDRTTEVKRQIAEERKQNQVP